MVEDPQPSGAGWLFHSKTLESYLNLLASSQRDDTLEACFGTLQNLTGHGGVVRTRALAPSRSDPHILVLLSAGADLFSHVRRSPE